MQSSALAGQELGRGRCRSASFGLGVLAAQGGGVLTGHFCNVVGLRLGRHQMWCVDRIASTGVNDITGESRVFTEAPGGSPVLLLQGW